MLNDLQESFDDLGLRDGWAGTVWGTVAWKKGGLFAGGAAGAAGIVHTPLGPGQSGAPDTVLPLSV